MSRSQGLALVGAAATSALVVLDTLVQVLGQESMLGSALWVVLVNAALGLWLVVAMLRCADRVVAALNGVREALQERTSDEEMRELARVAGVRLSGPSGSMRRPPLRSVRQTGPSA